MTAVFEIGDIISNLSKSDIRVITNITDIDYEFMQIKGRVYKDIFGQLNEIEKGSKSTQPMEIVHKHFSIIEL